MLDNNTCPYDFIEVMTCEGGCIGGGGQPIKLNDQEKIKEKRSNGLYNIDKNMQKRVSYENRDILKIYKEFYQEPCSNIAKKYLHRSFLDKSSILRGYDEKEKN